MTFPNKELLLTVKDCGRLVLRVNGVEFADVIDGGKDGDSTII